MKKLALGSLFAFLVAAPLAQAQVLVDQPKGYVGLEAGYVKPESIDGRFAYGVDLGLRMTSGLIGSVFYDASSAKQSGVNTQLTHYGVGVAYNFADLGAGGSFYGGLRLGAGMTETTPDGADKTSSTRFAAGPIVGYDYMLPNMGGFSVGGQTNVLWTFYDKTQTAWYAMVDAKLWF